MLRSANGNHRFIDGFGKAPVQTQFFLAVESPGFEAAEIQEAEVQGFLELVGVGAGENDPGNVGLKYPDFPNFVG